MHCCLALAGRSCPSPRIHGRGAGRRAGAPLGFGPATRWLAAVYPARRLAEPAGRRPGAPHRRYAHVAARGEGGLTGLALDAAFADNRLIYLAYNSVL
ncbi:MAG: PQQ-dependent sugar dehydrogenase [Clostridiales bacterium]|nr:PQQ-dependent sugar dehydrogenase [Clostridiales bacterium]